MTPADARYAAARNALIPEAAAHADATIPEPHFSREISPDAWDHFDRAWDAAFLRRMDALARSRGIVR